MSFGKKNPVGGGDGAILTTNIGEGLEACGGAIQDACVTGQATVRTPRAVGCVRKAKVKTDKITHGSRASHDPGGDGVLGLAMLRVGG